MSKDIFVRITGFALDRDDFVADAGTGKFNIEN